MYSHLQLFRILLLAVILPASADGRSSAAENHPSVARPWIAVRLPATNHYAKKQATTVTPRSAQQVSQSGFCGEKGDGYTCINSGFGDCCSQYGYCGSGTSFCGSGCDGAYGNCEGSSVSIPTSSSAALSATSTLSSASTIEPAQSSATGPPGCEEDANGLGDLAGPNTTFCTFQQQLECYALPYGVLGFASDVTTLYTVTLLWLGRRPLMPWRQLDKGLLTIILGGLTVTGAGAAAVANAIRCSNKWELVAISAWKLGLSVSTGLMAIHAGAMARHYTKRHRSRAVFPKIGRWLCLYSLPLLAGIAGLCSLSFTTSSGVPIYLQPERSAPMALTVVLLLALPAALVLSLGGGLWRSILKDPGLPQHPLLYWPTVVVYLFAVLWGFSAFVLAGWIIACFAENLIGVPSPGNLPLFIAYFITKRFVMVSM